MLDYSQPNFYKFSEDSIKLAKLANQQITGTNVSVLDLCCGCGVIGIELCLLNENVKKICFLEKQRGFFDHLKININFFLEKKNIETLIVNQSFKEEFTQNNFDIIVCNPPYFNQDNNKLGPNKNRNQCRFFSEEDFFSLLNIIHKKLNRNNGMGFSLFRKNEWDENKLQRFLLERKLSCKIITLDKKNLVLFVKSLDID